MLLLSPYDNIFEQPNKTNAIDKLFQISSEYKIESFEVSFFDSENSKKLIDKIICSEIEIKIILIFQK